jgi:hypothetical protein
MKSFPHLLLQEFVSMYRAAEDELQLILQQAAAAAAEQKRIIPVSVGRAAGNTKLLDPGSTTKPNDYISAADFLDAEALAYEADLGMQFDEEDAEEYCYADDAELNTAVHTLCAKLLSRRPLLSGTASAEQHCRELEVQIAGLEAEVAGKNSPAAKRAAGKRLAAVMQLKCLQIDLTCTLLEQHAAAEDLTAGGPATFKLHWHAMMKLEGRARSLKKQLSQQHGEQLQLEPFPERAAAAVLALATAYKLQVLRIRSRAFACLSLCSSVRKLEKNRSGS